MHLVLRSCALLSTAALTAALLAAAPSAAAAAAPTAPPERGPADRASVTSAQALLNWERIAVRTVYTDTTTPTPVGVPILGFTSLAMHRAVQASLSRNRASSERAALIAAAYRVLQHYHPGLRGKLGADRAAGLASVRPGPAKRFGIKVGKRAARGVLRERVGDHYLDPNIHYTLPPAPGIWQPSAPGGAMLGAWIGSLRHLVVRKHVKVGGPDALTSSGYTAQFEEVKSLGLATSTTRTAAQRQTALFFNATPSPSPLTRSSATSSVIRCRCPTRPASSRPSTPRKPTPSSSAGGSSGTWASGARSRRSGMPSSTATPPPPRTTPGCH